MNAYAIIVVLAVLVAAIATAIEQAQLIGLAMRVIWPDRAYFVEVWQEGRRGFAQVFQPFGVPRNRP